MKRLLLLLAFGVPLFADGMIKVKIDKAFKDMSVAAEVFLDGKKVMTTKHAEFGLPAKSGDRKLRVVLTNSIDSYVVTKELLVSDGVAIVLPLGIGEFKKFSSSTLRL